MINKWDIRFREMAQLVSTWSKDTNTKVGAVIVDKDNIVLSQGYNGFPIGCDDSVKARYERPQKYMYTEHAERNAIYFAARNGVMIKGSRMYLTWYPCCDCCKAIIQSGISKIMCYEPDWNDDSWGESFRYTKEMLAEANIEVVFCN